MADTDNRCYTNRTGDNGQNIYRVSSPFICPGTQSPDGNSRCCGGGGICLGNGICQAIQKTENATGFYIGSCTDRDFTDRAVCNNECSAFRVQDIVWSSEDEQWYCCGLNADGYIKCKSPSKQHFSAPDPQALQSAYSVSSSSFMATATAIASDVSTSLASAPAATVTIQPDIDDGGGGLSTGGKVGIGVGVSVVALLAILGVAFWLLRKRRRARNERMDSGHLMQDHQDKSGPTNDMMLQAPPLRSSHGMATQQPIVEAPIGSERTERTELSGTSTRSPVHEMPS